MALVLLLFSAAFGVMTVVRATAKPFWHDEIVTLVAAGLPSVGALWTALGDGLDLAPPLNTLATRAVHATLGAGPVLSRLPAMLGFWAACLLVFAMVRRRTNALLASAALVLPCYTAAYRFAYEARGYGLMTACFALALYAWSEAAAGRTRRRNLSLLAVALAAGLWAHYYAILAFAPVAAGEAVRWARDRRPDWPMWAAIAAGGAALLPLVPLIRVGAAHAATFWSRGESTGAIATYRFLLSPLSDWWFVIGAGLVVAAAAAARFTEAGETSPRDGLPVHELAAGLTALAVPVLGVALGGALSGGLVPRYVLPAAVAFAIAIPYLVWRFAPRNGWADAVLCGVLVAAMAHTVVDSLRPGRFVFRSPLADRGVLGEALAGPDPVVVTGGLVFLQFWYYAPSAMRQQLTYVADPDAALRLTGSNTIDRGLMAIARWAPVRVEPYDAFVASHPSFLVYAHGSGWILERLAEAGADVGPGQGGDSSAQLMRVSVGGG
jgi:hypothetical protein